MFLFKYLGSIFAADGTQEPDIKRRIGIATTRAGQLRHIFNSKSVTLATKLRLYQAAVVSLFTYGCEAWAMTPKTTRQLNGANSRLLSRFTGRTAHEEARNPSLDMVASIRARRLCWLGHILRMEDVKTEEGETKTRLVKLAAIHQHTAGYAGSIFMDAPRGTLEEIMKVAEERGEWNSLVRALNRTPARVRTQSTRRRSKRTKTKKTRTTTTTTTAQPNATTGRWVGSGLDAVWVGPPRASAQPNVTNGYTTAQPNATAGRWVGSGLDAVWVGPPRASAQPNVTVTSGYWIGSGLDAVWVDPPHPRAEASADAEEASACATTVDVARASAAAKDTGARRRESIEIIGDEMFFEETTSDGSSEAEAADTIEEVTETEEEGEEEIEDETLTPGSSSDSAGDHARETKHNGRQLNEVRVMMEDKDALETKQRTEAHDESKTREWAATAFVPSSYESEEMAEEECESEETGNKEARVDETAWAEAAVAPSSEEQTWEEEGDKSDDGDETNADTARADATHESNATARAPTIHGHHAHMHSDDDTSEDHGPAPETALTLSPIEVRTETRVEDSIVDIII